MNVANGSFPRWVLWDRKMHTGGTVAHVFVGYRLRGCPESIWERGTVPIPPGSVPILARKNGD